MLIERGRSLRSLNGFGFESRAERYAEASDENALVELVEHAGARGWPLLVLGAGSNVVPTGDVAGLVLRAIERRVRVEPRGSPTPREAGAGAAATRAALVTATAGVGWHDLVRATLALGLDGLENLSLIPGTVGAAPVQNIGAYGVELAERLHSLRAYHRPSREWRELDAADCAFGYRDSLFKRRPGEYVIGAVTFDLGAHRERVTDYASLAAALAERGIERPSATEVSDAVIAVRRARLPDPRRVGNVGSYFHNPVVTTARAAGLRARFPGLVTYPQPDGTVRLAAGWMIDHLGFRGEREDGVSVHERQALVLINDGDGDAGALLRLAARIRAAVEETFGVTLMTEPTVLDAA